MKILFLCIGLSALICWKITAPILVLVIIGIFSAVHNMFENWTIMNTTENPENINWKLESTGSFE